MINNEDYGIKNSSSRNVFINSFLRLYSVLTCDYSILSPKQQLADDVAPQDVQCKENHVLVFRTNGSPACVYEKTAEKKSWEIIKTTSKVTSLTINGLPDVIHRGDFFEIFGTGKPGSAITAEITNEEGEIINSITAEIDSKGNWKLDEPIIVALDIPFGKYSSTITDGRENIVKQLTLESDKIIIITPNNLEYGSGQRNCSYCYGFDETMKFKVTALPNKPIEIIIEDPLGKEIYADIFEIDETGFIEFEYQTEQTSVKGIYTIIATQDQHREIIFVALEEFPQVHLNISWTNHCHHTSSPCIPTWNISGPASEILSFQVTNSLGEKLVADKITLPENGQLSQELDVQDYLAGVYFITVRSGSVEVTKPFVVG